ncbi:ParB/RepB/Spo0J family partition protein [Kaustia mangrovi]|uniref:ParB/RepB/Spo0J family partition protein n=1 Tax=Kaustia mangrovi TaxID=2593653 RepID=A0A7S8HC80_9HYPH|nr:ParB/RepB/Spo0J family partition protein [Kaustia mangrovi]QPC43350.1 ParB/RepB/Spo0J family partition protein [Kaustia mangrovi]
MVQQGRKRLGRGLAALIGEDTVEAPAPEESRPQRGLKQMPIAFLRRNPHNPRKTFQDEDLDDLAQSLREKGMLQPLLVRPVADPANAYEIVAGERRWRAAQKAGLHEVPVIVRELSDAEALEVALVENIQRADLNPVEEAEGYRRLMEEFHYTQHQLAEAVGKSRSHVANTMRLLGLSGKVRDMLAEGTLTAGHARALIASDAADELAERIATLGLSVREAEELARDSRAGEETGQDRQPPARKPEKDPDTLALERSLAETLGLKVLVNHKGQRGGELRISYRTLEQLDDLCQRLSRQG